jgi:ParB family chromosome partitioning protein
LSLGTLGDERAIEDLMVLVDPRSAEVTDEDRALAPFAAEALGAMLPKIADQEKKIEVRDTVERLAREGAAGVRQRAIVGLRRSGDDRSRSLIERIVGDRYEDFAVRHEGIKQLGIAAKQSSENVLAEVLDDDNRMLRQQSLEALGRIFPDDKTRVSMLALNSRHWDINQPAAMFLAKRGDPTTLVSRIADIKDWAVRKRLRQGLVRRRACPATALVKLLASDQPAPRAEAAWIAGATGGRELADAVLAAVQRSESDWEHERTNGKNDLPAREEAWLASLWAAGRLEANAKKFAVAAAKNAEAPSAIRQEALRFIQVKGDASDLAVVKGCLSAQDGGVRAAAAAAAVAIARDRAPALLREIPVADAPAMVPVADAAIPIAGREQLSSDTGRQLVLPVLVGKKRLDELIAIAQAGGKDPVRLVAIATIGRIGGEKAIAALSAILKSEKDDGVRAAAFKALRRAQRAAAKTYPEGQDQERKGGGFGGFPGGGMVMDDEDEDDYSDDDDDDDDGGDDGDGEDYVDIGDDMDPGDDDDDGDSDDGDEDYGDDD